MFEFISNSPNDPTYFIPIIFCFLVVLLMTLIIIHYIKKDINNKEEDLDHHIMNPVSPEDNKKRNQLRFRYLIVYLLTKCNIWSREAFNYALFSTYHKFSIQEIGVIYFIGAVCSLIGGPITGNLADIYGRRLFSVIYNISIICNLSLRLTGDRYMAYISQIMAGFGNNLINTSFESWLVFETGKLFGDENSKEKDIFLKSVFKE